MFGFGTGKFKNILGLYVCTVLVSFNSCSLKRWSEPQFSYFRYFFCLEDTDDNLCMVPIDGGEDYETEEDWCQDKYNASSCTYIRDEAQADAGFALLAFYTGLAASGCVLLLLMFLMINLLETIISRPIVQKSRETNVPAWLLLPTVGTGLVGAVFVFSPSSLLSSISGTEGAWIGIVYLVSAALFLVALLLGWFLSAFTIRNNIDKNNKNVAVLIVIGVMAANTVMLAAIFVASIMFSGNLLITPIDQSARGQVACFVDRGVSCTCCDCEITEDVCPEWTLEEVTKILQSQLKQSGTLAAIFILYSISVLRFSFVLRKHLTLYQIDYV